MFIYIYTYVYIYILYIYMNVYIYIIYKYVYIFMYVNMYSNWCNFICVPKSIPNIHLTYTTHTCTSLPYLHKTHIPHTHSLPIYLLSTTHSTTINWIDYSIHPTYLSYTTHTCTTYICMPPIPPYLHKTHIPHSHSFPTPPQSTLD